MHRIPVVRPLFASLAAMLLTAAVFHQTLMVPEPTPMAPATTLA